jgi:hypothetical protein
MEVIAGRMDESTVVVGDFNAPPRRRIYTRTTPTGSIIEEFVDDNALDILHVGTTFLSFAGHTSTPDFAMVHLNAMARSSLQLLNAVGGCGHRVLLVTVKPKKRPLQMVKLPRWNLRKALWAEYKLCTDEMITEDLISDNVDVSASQFVDTILKCTYKCIPREQVERHKPFWTTALTKLKCERNNAR